MPDKTPLEKLDDAIHEFYRETTDIDNGNLGGWVLSYQHSFIEDLGPEISPIAWAGGYALSPGLSPFAAVGVSSHATKVIQRIYVDLELGMYEDDDEDD